MTTHNEATTASKPGLRTCPTDRSERASARTAVRLSAPAPEGAPGRGHESAAPKRTGARERGSALILVVLLTLVVTALCTTMLVTSNTDRQISTNEADAERALFASKAGLNYCYNLYKNGSITATTAGAAFDSYQTAIATPLDGGTFTGKLFDQSSVASSGQLYKISSTGTYKKATRTTELVFQVVPDALQYGYMAFNEADLHRHDTSGPATFLIKSTIFSNNSVSVPKGVTIDGSIVASGSISVDDGSPSLVTTVTGDVISYSISTDANVGGTAKLLTSVIPTTGTPNVTDNVGNTYVWYSNRSNPASSVSGSGTIAGGTTRYVIQNGDPFTTSIFTKGGDLILNPPINVIKYVPAPKLDYQGMKAEADKDDATFFTSMTAAVTYLASKKVTEVVGGQTMTTIKVGTTTHPEFLYVRGNMTLTVDSTLSADAPSSGKLDADGLYIEGGIYTTGDFSFDGRAFNSPAENPAGYDQLHINALPYCYPAVLAYEEPPSGVITSWTPLNTPAIGNGGSQFNMSSPGGDYGGSTYLNGVVFCEGDMHLHHTKDPHEIIKFNGAELGWKLHNCDYFQFTYDKAVGCTKWLINNGGTPQIVSYREVR